MSDSFDRRAFLGASGGALAAVWLGRWADASAALADAAGMAGTPLSQVRWQSLTPAQAQALDAFAARIIPTDDLPGAREAGAVFFIDKALAGWASRMRPAADALVQALDAAAAAAHPDRPHFARLDAAAQDAILREVEQSARGPFGAMRLAVVAGTFALPSHGGNRGKAGWKIMGFEDRYVWSKPYGWYDRTEGAHD